MNASAFDSAVHALAAFCGVAGVSMLTDAVPAMNWRQLAALFLITFARAVLKYLDTHPLEDMAGRVTPSVAAAALGGRPCAPSSPFSTPDPVGGAHGVTRPTETAHS